MSTDSSALTLGNAANARQFLLVALAMNLLAAAALLWGDLGMIPGGLYAVAILGAAAGISFLRPFLDASLFVTALLWLTACLPVLNLALLLPLYRRAEAARSNLLFEQQRENALDRARERSNTPLPVNNPVKAPVIPAHPAQDHGAIEYTPPAPKASAS